MAPVPVLSHRAASRIVVEANIAQCHHVVYEVAKYGVVNKEKSHLCVQCGTAHSKVITTVNLEKSNNAFDQLELIPT